MWQSAASFAAAQPNKNGNSFWTSAANPFPTALPGVFNRYWFLPHLYHGYYIIDLKLSQVHVVVNLRIMKFLYFYSNLDQYCESFQTYADHKAPWSLHSLYNMKSNRFFISTKSIYNTDISLQIRYTAFFWTNKKAVFHCIAITNSGKTALKFSCSMMISTTR